eukprot:evm.model.NODE_1642_length_6147_cov_34.217342.1
MEKLNRRKAGAKGQDAQHNHSDCPPYVVEYGLQVHQGVWYVASTKPRSHESFLETASRALEEATGEDGGEEEVDSGDEDDDTVCVARPSPLSFQLAAHLPRITELHRPAEAADGKTHAYHFFIATTAVGSCQIEEDLGSKGDRGSSSSDNISVSSNTTIALNATSTTAPGARRTIVWKTREQNWRVAVLVNDMNEFNIDAALVSQDRRRVQVVGAVQEEERIVSLANGCICCTLREDLLAQIVALAQEEEFDYLLIESSGISEPLAVAETFTFEDEHGRSLSSLARLDTTVTVVDAPDLHRHLRARERVVASKEREGCPISTDEENDKTLADLMCEQIEFADVVILNKIDLLPAAGGVDGPLAVSSTGASSQTPLNSLSALRALVLTLNPGAKVLLAEHGRVDGYLWLATQMQQMVFWSLAGAVHSFTTRDYDRWLCATDPVEWPETLTLTQLQANWTPVWGDRRQEVVLIGVQMDQAAVEKALDACLLTDMELESMPWEWAETFLDPFFPSGTGEESGHEDGDSGSEYESDEEEENN